MKEGRSQGAAACGKVTTFARKPNNAEQKARQKPGVLPAAPRGSLGMGICVHKVGTMLRATITSPFSTRGKSIVQTEKG